MIPGHLAVEKRDGVCVPREKIPEEKIGKM